MRVRWKKWLDVLTHLVLDLTGFPLVIDESACFSESDGLIVLLGGEEERMIARAHPDFLNTDLFQSPKDFMQLELSVSFAPGGRQDDIIPDDAEHRSLPWIVASESDGDSVFDADERAPGDFGMGGDFPLKIAVMLHELQPVAFRELGADCRVALLQQAFDGAGREVLGRRKGEHR